MHNAPIDEHTDEYEQLAGLSALDVLEGDELARFVAHSAGCERCRLMVRLDRETLARLALVAPAMDPSPDFKERLMRRAAAELAASAAALEPVAPADRATAADRTTPAELAAPEPIPLRPRPARVVPLWRRSPWLSALAAVFVVAVVTAGAFAYENQTVATYALTGSVPGNARVVIHRSGDAELDMNGVPNPDPGFVYEAWIIPPGAKPVAAGVSSTGDAQLKLTGDLRGATIAITRETGRVDAPTSDPIMATLVQGT